MRVIKTSEEIRESLGLSQSKFAGMIGSTLRTYQGRFDGSQPKWNLNELIAIAELNNGEVKVDSKGKTYEITIKEID